MAAWPPCVACGRSGCWRPGRGEQSLPGVLPGPAFGQVQGDAAGVAGDPAGEHPLGIAGATDKAPLPAATTHGCAASTMRAVPVRARLDGHVFDLDTLTWCSHLATCMRARMPRASRTTSSTQLTALFEQSGELHREAATLLQRPCGVARALNDDFRPVRLVGRYATIPVTSSRWWPRIPQRRANRHSRSQLW